MSLQTPTTSEVAANIISQMEATLNQSIPLLPKSFIRVMSKALAGVFILLYKYGGFIFQQIFVSTASIEETVINGVSVSPLIAHGRLIGVGDPVPATNAELLIDITVTTQGGTLVSGTQLINKDNGVTYIIIGDVLLGAPTVQATIKAVADQAGGGGAGVIGNLEPADIVSFANPLSNVASDAVVDSQTVTGANAEATEVYRQRIVDRFQKRPQGGAYSDYEIWSEEVAGIVNAYPYTSDEPGQVDVYIEATEASSGSADGIPTPAQLTAVLESIELNENGLATRRPANALANTLPIVRTGFDSVVTGLVVDNPGDVQSDITAAIQEFFLEFEPFVDGLTITRKDRITNSALTGLVDNIVTAANGIFTDVTFDATGIGGDLPLYVLGQGEKAKSTGTTYV